MDNYDLSNLPPLADWVDTRESHRHPGLTDEQNTRVTFAGRSATVSRPEQAELQQPLLTYEVQLLAEQTAIADFDISLASDILDPLVDEPVVDKPKDPFASLAAYRPLALDDNPQHPSVSELGLGLGLLEGFTVEDLTDLAAEDFTDVVLLAEPEGNDVLEPSVQSEYQQQLVPPEQPVQSRGESDSKGIVIAKSANPDADSNKRSRKRRALEPENVLMSGIPKSSIEHSIEMHFQKSLCGSERLTKTRQEPNSKEIETRSQSAAMPETSATSPKKIRINPDKSLRDRVKKETLKWIVERKGLEKPFLCSYPDCGWTSSARGNLQVHIFTHIGISIHKCPYPECADNPYFCHSYALKIHLQTYHKKEQPYHCTLCDKRFGRSGNYKRHMRNIHKTV